MVGSWCILMAVGRLDVSSYGISLLAQRNCAGDGWKGVIIDRKKNLGSGKLK
jgi:hypothetical protein